MAKFYTIFPSAVDTGGQFATGVNDTGGKFADGVNDAGGKLPPVATTPAANLPLVSTRTHPQAEFPEMFVILGLPVSFFLLTQLIPRLRSTARTEEVWFGLPLIQKLHI